MPSPHHDRCILISHFKVAVITFLGFSLFADPLAAQNAAQKKKPAKSFKVHSPETLAVGKAAPDIEAEDLDGVNFKLSDYRGKVVVIDFWGDW